jgi:6-phosphogluconate dehydrogenase
MEVNELADTFNGWNEGDLESFLIEITGIVLGKTDEATGRPLIDVIVDEAEQKGTGRWTAQDALERGVPLTAITEAVFARTLSARREERARGSRELAGPRPEEGNRLDRSFVDDVQRALYASKVVAYAQGFAQERVVNVAVERGVAVPAFTSALSWYDGYRRERGPANLVQGLRDFFGAHTYRRVDRDGVFHTRWRQDGTEVRTDT